MKASPWDNVNGSKEPSLSKDSTQRPRPDSNRGPFDPKSDAVTHGPLRLLPILARDMRFEILFSTNIAEILRARLVTLFERFRDFHFTDRITYRQSVKLIRNLEFRASSAQLYVYVWRTPW